MNRQPPAWIEPIAAALADDRRQLIAFVSDKDPAFWELPSAVDGWKNRDILAHLAGGNDQLIQTLLRAVANGEEPDPHALALDTDAENARRIAERREWSIEALIGELAHDSDEVQALLARLKDSDRDLRPEGLGLTLGEFLRVVQHEHHDLIHLDQFRKAKH